MALPSQSGQPARRRIHMDRRPRRARRVILVAAVGILVVLATVRLAMVDRAADADGPIVAGPVAAAISKPSRTPASGPRQTHRGRSGSTGPPTRDQGRCPARAVKPHHRPDSPNQPR